MYIDSVSFTSIDIDGVGVQIVLQTTAVATGTLPLAAGFVGGESFYQVCLLFTMLISRAFAVVPALAQLNPLQDKSLPLVLSWQSCLGWSFAVAFFGVFLAIPLRRQVIVKEQLTFPSGTATAQVIGVLHGKPLQLGSTSEEDEGIRRRRGGDYEPLRAGEAADDEIEGISSHGKDKKVVDAKAWTALTTSFAVSAIYTVSCILSVFYPYHAESCKE
jgi:uncharacterized oligopeptide transporter (OPT) family protein